MINMDYTMLFGLVIGLAGVVAAAIPSISGHLDKKKAREIEEKKLDYEHQEEMNRVRTVKTHIQDAMDYDFGRDMVMSRESTKSAVESYYRTAAKYRDVAEGSESPSTPTEGEQ